MIDQAWFDTEGKRHLNRFFRQIKNALEYGRAHGLKPKRINADDLIRLYRGEAMVLSDEQIDFAKQLSEEGWTVQEIAQRLGVHRNTIYNHVRWRKRATTQRNRVKNNKRTTI